MSSHDVSSETQWWRREFLSTSDPRVEVENCLTDSSQLPVKQVDQNIDAFQGLSLVAPGSVA